jgi:hypothetical protein
MFGQAPIGGIAKRLGQQPIEVRGQPARGQR